MLLEIGPSMVRTPRYRLPCSGRLSVPPSEKVCRPPSKKSMNPSDSRAKRSPTCQRKS